MAGGEPQADGGAEVEDVEGEAVEAEGQAEALDDVGQGVEAVAEVLGCGAFAVAEAGVVGGDQPVAGAERVEEPPELVGGGRESVQQQEHGGVGRSGLPVEDAQAVDIDVAVMDVRDRQLAHANH